MNALCGGRPGRALHFCVDGAQVAFKAEIIGADRDNIRSIPRNGVRRTPDGKTISVVSGTQTSRDMTAVIRGNFGKTYTFPRTALVAKEKCFRENSKL